MTIFAFVGDRGWTPSNRNNKNNKTAINCNNNQQSTRWWNVRVDYDYYILLMSWCVVPDPGVCSRFSMCGQPFAGEN